jgi:tRNA(Ile)-lysidine synthase
MSITVETIRLKVISYLKKNKISKKSNILVAYSGGPDSSALLWLLKSIQEDISFSLSALYVNHGIRSQSEMSDEIFQVKKIADKLNIRIEQKNLEYGFIANESALTGRSVEDLAREYRYSFIEKMKEGIGATHVAMGHTLDDQIETLIMRFFQGSGLHGFSGIPDKRDFIIRPLLEIEKKELEEYIKTWNIPFVTDSTNLEPVYLRNKIRLNMIPVINEIFPGYKKSINIFTKKMEMVQAVLRDKNWKPDIYLSKEGDPWFFSHDFIDLPAYYKVEILYKSWDMWQNKPFERLPYKFLSTAIGSNSKNLSNILLDGYSCRLMKHKDVIIWKRVVVVSSKKSYLKVITPGENELFPGLYLKLEENGDLLNDKIWINKDKLKYPLIVRSKISGDRIALSEGMKTLKKLFNDWGVLPGERWKIPVIEDRAGIVAVMGKSLSYSNRIAFNYKECISDTVKLVISANYMESISE